MSNSIKASQLGIQRIDHARRRKGWNKTSERWCTQSFTSKATLKRFWAGQAIRKDTFMAICNAVGLDWQEVVELDDIQGDRQAEQHIDESPVSQEAYQDWGSAPDPRVFYGRTEQVATLQQWLIHDECRLVTVLGMGGIGKTTLAIKMAHLLHDQFDFVIWRSLRNAPLIEEILIDWIQCLSRQQEGKLPTYLDGKILRLIHYLRTSRCLLVLDNAESILQGGDRTNRYRSGYEGYGDLFKCIGETAHRSCLMLTSRELPKGLSVLAGDRLPTRCLPLSGMPLAAGKDLLTATGITAELERDWSTLTQNYGGNPLALKIVATAIQEQFDSNISEFLKFSNQQTYLLDDIYELLEQQFLRLTPLEQSIMYWLAINREPTTLLELQADFVRPIVASELLQGLASLQRRSLVERIANSETFPQQPLFTQQPVVMEYMTNRLITTLSDEIITLTPALFARHPLIKARAKNYIRKSQISFILKPLINHVIDRLGTLPEFVDRLNQILNKLRIETATVCDGKGDRITLSTQDYVTDPSADVTAEPSPLLTQLAPIPSYAGGNILNLLRQLQVNLKGYDFSGLAVWQANCHDLSLHHVNFAGADLADSMFTECLGNILSAAFGPIFINPICSPPQEQCVSEDENDVFPQGVDKLLATCDTDCNVRLWQIMTGQLQMVCQGHTNWVRAVVFSPDGQTLASASADQTVKVWDVNNGQCVQTFRGHLGEVFSVAFSPCGKSLISSSGDRTIKVWDIQTGQCLKTFTGHTNWIRSIAFSDDGQTVASGSDDHTIKLWDTQTGHCIQTLTGHESAVRSVAFSPSGHLLASGSGDQTIKLWQVKKGICLHTYLGHRDGIYSVAFNPNSHMLVSGSGDHTVRIWDVRTHDCVKTLQGHTNQIVSTAFCPLGAWVICVSLDQTVRLWDWQTGQCIRAWFGKTDWAFPVAFGAKGKILATGSCDRTIKLWDVKTNQCFKRLQGHTDMIYAVAFSPDGDYLASGSTDQTVRIWDIHTGQCCRILRGHTDWLFSVAFSPDGETLATGSADCTVKLWNWQQEQCLNTLKGHTQKLFSVAFSPDGKTVASASTDKTIRLWNIHTGQCLNVLTGHRDRVYSVAFSPDGSTLASSSTDQTIRLWDYVTGQCIQSLEGHTNWVFSVAFSPDGRTLASGSHDHTVRVWDVNTGHCRHICSGHTHLVSSVAFNPDGTSIVSGSQDQSARLWNPDTGEELMLLRSDRLYEGMNIKGTTGLTQAQKNTIKALGAVE